MKECSSDNTFISSVYRYIRNNLKLIHHICPILHRLTECYTLCFFPAELEARRQDVFLISICFNGQSVLLHIGEYLKMCAYFCLLLLCPECRNGICLTAVEDSAELKQAASSGKAFTDILFCHPRKTTAPHIYWSVPN